MILNTSLVLISWCNAGMYGEAGVRSVTAADEVRLGAATPEAREAEFRGIKHPQWHPPLRILHITQTVMIKIKSLCFQDKVLSIWRTHLLPHQWLVHKDPNCALPVGCVMQQFMLRPQDQPWSMRYSIRRLFFQGWYPYALIPLQCLVSHQDWTQNVQKCKASWKVPSYSS